MNDNIRIRVSVEFPDRPCIEAAFDVPQEEALKFLYPVPRNHDSPFDGPAAAEAREIRRQRFVILPSIGNAFATYVTQTLHKMLHEADPVNGYDRKDIQA